MQFIKDKALTAFQAVLPAITSLATTVVKQQTKLTHELLSRSAENASRSAT